MTIGDERQMENEQVISFDKETGNYIVALKSIEVSGVKVDSSMDLKAVVDSGTSLIYGPRYLIEYT